MDSYFLNFIPPTKKKIKNQYEQLNSGNFFLLILLLVFYLILSAGLNAYKIYCNVKYSPMARSLINYLMNPFFNIIYFYVFDDFNHNYSFLIVSVIIDFLGFVYNEYIILYFYGLEYETDYEISKRSENTLTSLKTFDEEDAYYFNCENNK